MNINKLHIALPTIESAKLAESDSSTDDGLLPRNNNYSDDLLKACKNRKYVKCGILPYRSIIGLGLVVWGIIIMIFTPFQIMMNERLRMLPGLPPYDWWANPPDVAICRTYLFNITNSEEFLSGTDAKLRVKEVGPIVYREKLNHTNITFNQNGTMSYTAARELVYLPEMNSVNLNDTIYVPNMAVLLLTSKYHDANFLIRMGINMLLRKYQSQPIVKTTVYNYLWNFTDPLLEMGQQTVPFMLPKGNIGVLYTMYRNFVDVVTVYIGAQNGHEKYFAIDKYDGSEYLPGFGNKCSKKVQNSTEGLCYPQHLPKNYTLKYWRKSICRVMNLEFDHELHRFGVTLNKYILEKNSYDRTGTGVSRDEDCYRGNPILPNGLSDISPCYFGTPVAISFPHYLYASDKVQNYVEGLTPNFDDHQAYVILEPTTGIPIEGKARSQINLVMRDVGLYTNNVSRFRNTAIPLAWIEYHQVDVPWNFKVLIYVVVIVMRPLQKVASVVFIVLGLYFIYTDVRKRRRKTELKAKQEATPFLHY